MFDALGRALLDHVWEGLTPGQRGVLGHNRVVGPANGPAWDCTMLFTSLSRITPRTDSTGCVQFYRATFRVGFLQQVAYVDDSGRIPLATEVTEDGMQILSMVDPLRQLVESFDYEALGVQGRDMEGYEPLGPAGGLGGGQWFVTFWGEA